MLTDGNRAYYTRPRSEIICHGPGRLALVMGLSCPRDDLIRTYTLLKSFQIRKPYTSGQKEKMKNHHKQHQRKEEGKKEQL